MNVGQLKKAIADLPDGMPVLIQAECGTNDEPTFYVIPAHVEHSPCTPDGASAGWPCETARLVYSSEELDRWEK